MLVKLQRPFTVGKGSHVGRKSGGSVSQYKQYKPGVDGAPVEMPDDLFDILPKTAKVIELPKAMQPKPKPAPSANPQKKVLIPGKDRNK